VAAPAGAATDLGLAAAAAVFFLGGGGLAAPFPVLAGALIALAFGFFAAVAAAGEGVAVLAVPGLFGPSLTGVPVVTVVVVVVVVVVVLPGKAAAMLLHVLPMVVYQNFRKSE